MSTSTTHIKTEKQLVPVLRFKEFENDWKIESLAKMYANIVVGFVGTISKDYCDQEIGIQFVRTLNVKDGWFSNKKLQYVTEEFHNKNKKSQIKNGDILIARVGANMGMVCEVTGLFGEANSANVIIIKSDSKRSSSFYTSYLTSSGGQKQIQSKGAGGAQEVLNISVAKTIMVPDPTLPEQQKIASFLIAVDEKIQKLTKKKELLEQYKKGVMQQLFSGQLRFKDENGNSYPDWEEKRLGDICEIKGRIGYRGYTVKDIVSKDEGVITLSPSNIKKGQLKFENSTYISWFKYEESPEIKVELNDVLLVKTASVGKTAFVSHLPEPATINPQIVILKRTSLFPQYLGYLVFHSTVQKQIVAAVGAGAVPNLSQESISNFVLPCPSNEEQQKIATYLSRIDTKIENVNNQITQTQTFKKGLLQQMFV